MFVSAVHPEHASSLLIQRRDLCSPLVDLQCKCVRQETPRIGPIWGFPTVIQSKVFLEFWNFQKLTTRFSPKFNLGEKHVVGFYKFKILRVLLISLRLKNPYLGNILGYPASHIYIANPPNCCTSEFVCIHMSIYS